MVRQTGEHSALALWRLMKSVLVPSKLIMPCSDAPGHVLLLLVQLLMVTLPSEANQTRLPKGDSSGICTFVVVMLSNTKVSLPLNVTSPRALLEGAGDDETPAQTGKPCPHRFYGTCI